MKFIVDRPEENVLSLVRILGYELKSSRGKEFNCVRSISGAEYPRFHIFIIEEEKGKAQTPSEEGYKEESKLIFNLHLDQKKPSYSNSPAHSGEYQGEVVEGEVERIKKLLKGLAKRTNEYYNAHFSENSGYRREM